MLIFIQIECENIFERARCTDGGEIYLNVLNSGVDYISMAIYATS